MTDREIILHGLRDRDDDSRIALRRIAERCDRAEARVKELEAERGNLIVDVAAEMDRANKAEARVRELEAELSHSILDATAVLVEGKAKAEERVCDLDNVLEEINAIMWNTVMIRAWRPNRKSLMPIMDALERWCGLDDARAALAGGKE